MQQQLRVPAQRLQAHPLDTPFELEGVRITFLDANHCPGAVMILFEPPGGARPVLHTGDCRLVPAMQQEAALEVRCACGGMGLGGGVEREYVFFAAESGVRSGGAGVERGW